MDNTTSDDPDSIKIQEQPETPQQDKQELADKQAPQKMLPINKIKLKSVLIQVLIL